MSSRTVRLKAAMLALRVEIEQIVASTSTDSNLTTRVTVKEWKSSRVAPHARMHRIYVNLATDQKAFDAPGWEKYPINRKTYIELMGGVYCPGGIHVKNIPYDGSAVNVAIRAACAEIAEALQISRDEFHAEVIKALNEQDKENESNE